MASNCNIYLSFESPSADSACIVWYTVSTSRALVMEWMKSWIPGTTRSGRAGVFESGLSPEVGKGCRSPFSPSAVRRSLCHLSSVPHVAQGNMRPPSPEPRALGSGLGARESCCVSQLRVSALPLSFLQLLDLCLHQAILIAIPVDILAMVQPSTALLRPRISKSCDQCKARKVRCVSGEPNSQSCRNCVVRDLCFCFVFNRQVIVTLESCH